MVRGHSTSALLPTFEALEERLLLSVTSEFITELGANLAATGVIERAAPAEQAEADLAPYEPGNWDDRIPVGIVQHAGTDAHSYSGPYYGDQTLYVNWASANYGTATGSNYTVRLAVTGVGGGTYEWTDVTTPAGYYTYLTSDQPVGALSVGSHTFKLWLDYTNVVPEGVNEGNNYYERTIVISARVNTAPDIRGLPDITVDEDTTFPATDGSSGQADSVSDRLGFDGDTSAYLALQDATPTGTSYLLTEHWGGTWCDAEKSPTNTEDDMLCWAAAASNILEWTGWGLVGGMTNTDQVFQYFQNHWTDEGGTMEYGWDWWFDGTNPSQGWSGWSQVDVPGGGFYPSENFSSYLHSQETESQALAAIDQFIRAGYGTTLGIYGPGGHAITCWGFNYNPADTDQYYGVWVSDSDDDKSSTNPPDRLRYYEVALSGGRWYLQDYYGSDAWYIGSVQALAKSGNTNPNTYDLWAYASDAETPDSGLTFSIVGNTSPNCGVSIVSNRYIQVHPVHNWNGTSDVTVMVSDGQLTDTDTFRITVRPVNDAPVISGLPDKTLAENTSLNYTTDLWAYASDPETPVYALTFSITANTNPSCGVSIVANWFISVNPAAGWDGTSDVTVQVSDGALNGSDTFRITVTEAFVDLTGAFGAINVPNPTKAGDWEQVQVQVTNGGNTLASGWSTIELWASLDGNLSSGTDDYKLTETRPYVYLQPGQTGSYYAYFLAPGNVPAGTYDLIAVLDADNDFNETNPGGEGNNQAASADRFPMQNPDLTGSFGTVNLPARPLAGTWGYAFVGIQNTGAVQAYGYTDIQLLITTETPPSGEGPVQAVTRVLTTLHNQLVFLQPGQTGWYVAYFTLPADLPAGDYYLRAVVDSSNGIVETNEGNNVAYGHDRYQVCAACVDLTGAFGTIWLPNPTKAGDYGLVQVQVTNSGNVLASGWSTLQVWASGDGNLLTGADDYKLAETRPYLYLSPGQTGSYYLSFLVPGTIPAGTYDLLAVIDANNDIAETNPGGESNNQVVQADRFVMQAPTPSVGLVSSYVQPATGDSGFPPSREAVRGEEVRREQQPSNLGSQASSLSPQASSLRLPQSADADSHAGLNGPVVSRHRLLRLSRYQQLLRWQNRARWA
jgi:hypothetical protein